mmetsp:Transcript_27461/g.32215  ORF Transcript_27461/g.32215 Transcript_27461/m.32215 type:complete len:167 (+) Transcript_27461:680-1180(+)
MVCFCDFILLEKPRILWAHNKRVNARLAILELLLSNAELLQLLQPLPQDRDGVLIIPSSDIHLLHATGGTLKEDLKGGNLKMMLLDHYIAIAQALVGVATRLELYVLLLNVKQVLSCSDHFEDIGLWIARRLVASHLFREQLLAFLPMAVSKASLLERLSGRAIPV